MEKHGVDGLLVVGPYYNKPTQEGFYQHFAAVAKSTKLPIIIYNVPGRTGSNIAPETVARLAQDFDNIVAINISKKLPVMLRKWQNFIVCCQLILLFTAATTA